MGKIVQSLLLLSVFTLLGCGLPTNQMSAADRMSDMNWAFTIFKNNYAPAELKKDNLGIELSQVESDCMTLAEADMDNQAFLSLFQKCIHTFKDAHVGGQQMNNGLLPEFANVAHLGFTTGRTKTNVPSFDSTAMVKVEALEITSLLKGSDSEGAPLVPGDLIVEVDSRPLKDYLISEIVPYINLGQDETNLTLAGYNFSIRISMNLQLPLEDEVELKIKRGETFFNIRLPWIREDLLSFQLKQAPPTEEPATADEKEKSLKDKLKEIEKSKTFKTQLLDQNSLAQSFLGYQQLKSFFAFLDNPVELVTQRVQLLAKTGFRWVQFNPIFHSLFKGEYGNDSAVDLRLRTRIFPQAKTVSDLMLDPLFTAKVISTEKNQNYAYIQLSSFPADDKILAEWYRAITAIEDKGIKSVIIDTIDNGGGSLVHGMRILNMIRKKTIQFPSIQARLNNNWVNAFKTQAAFGADDYAKTIGARMVRDFNIDMKAGKKISRPFSVTNLDPFFLQNPAYGLSDDVKIVVMVNEMCVSMCDIFASVVQDNNMALVLGQKTMGGGGNVAQHGLSPVAKMGLSLTESLIVTSKGKYIENNGVIPDVEIDMVEDRKNGFSKAFEEAIKYLLTPTLP